MSRYSVGFFFSYLGLFFPLVLIFSHFPPFLLPFLSISCLLPSLLPLSLPLLPFLLTSESSYRNIKGKYGKKKTSFLFLQHSLVCLCVWGITLSLRIFWFAHIIYNYVITK